MIGANGLSRLIAIANSCPFIAGMQIEEFGPGSQRPLQARS